MLRQLIHYFRLDTELDEFDKIHTGIEKDVVFKGTNLWILMFAIIVASIGLNMNSTAVIIGAMLISPLMGPINGMGYSIATYNFPLFRKAVRNLGFAVFAGLIASTGYFALSPVSTAHSELLARTSPTIYDVLIALFGGLAGIVAISSRQKGNVIPGVAIATALMPPLCTAGYGLATGQFIYFFGAFYLFTINTVYIALAAVVTSKILKFPIISIIGDDQKKKINRWIIGVIVITLVPSIYFGYRLVIKEQFSENAGKFVKTVSIFEGNYLLDKSINVDRREITLVFGGSALSPVQKIAIKEKARIFNIDTAHVTISQGLSFDEAEKKNTERERLISEINRLNTLVKNQEATAEKLRETEQLGKQILSEISSLYPVIVTCSYSETLEFQQEDKAGTPLKIVRFGIKTPFDEKEKQKVTDWVISRLKSGRVTVYFEPVSP